MRTEDGRGGGCFHHGGTEDPAHRAGPASGANALGAEDGEAKTG